MPKFCIFDTETTGLFLFKDPETGEPIPADDPRQPRLAHFSAILLNDDLDEEDEIDLYVKPDGWEMPAEAGAVNGLTTKFLAENGTPIAAVLETYVRLVGAGYVMVAFNAQFDCKMMRGELRRAGHPDLFHETPNICVMRAAMALGVKKSGGGRGYPKLTDCSAHLGFFIPEAHSAKGDTRATLALFRHLHAVGALPDAKVHLAKTPPLAPAAVDPLPANAMPERF
ncbi:MAG: 3'-5' exonuclease [Mesorhizobium sp.]|nr:3'-5' exonuclease [Mesorhizobium sp.]MCO5085110.1 3'-5' exonuclease [Rhizobiaceae bacterium]MCO5164636.1 3'-5' exonuclease [Mesorhizobium sp.]